MAYGEGDRGVGGWLAFFLVTLGIFTPGATIVMTLLSFRQADTAQAYAIFPGLGTAEVALTVILCLACWFACYRLLKVFNRTSVRIAVATLIFIATVSVLIEPLVISSVSGVSFGTLMSFAEPQQFRPIIYATIWTLYLLISKRVKNTYSGIADDREMTEVFQ